MLAEVCWQPSRWIFLGSSWCRLIISKLIFCGSTAFFLLFSDLISCCFMKEFRKYNFYGTINFFINTESSEKAQLIEVPPSSSILLFSLAFCKSSRTGQPCQLLSCTCFTEQCHEAFWHHHLLSCPSWY